MTAFSSSPEIDILTSPTAATTDLESVPDTLEARLIRRAQSGDTAAFRTLVESHQDMIYRLCVQWLTCGEDAREACQDTFLKAWQALPAWQPKGKLGTWLYQIALNQCRDRARSRTTRQRRATVTLDHLSATPACPGASPDLAAARSGDMEKLQRGLAHLPEPARAVLLLCGMESLTYAEAAGVLRCSERALEGRLYRARRQLMDWWNGHP